jgi:hypothetical protein
MSAYKIVKSGQRTEEVTLTDIERFQRRLQSAVGQEQGVISEMCQVMVQMYQRLERLNHLEQRLEKLEGGRG